MEGMIPSTGDRYATTAMDIIGQSAILTDEDMDVIHGLKDELEDNFLHTQVFRTRTEMEVSVLNDMNFPTPDAKYWQCQREQNVHFHELVMLSYEYRKGLVEIKKLQRKLEALGIPPSDFNELESELVQIEIEKLSFISRNQERVAKDRIREVREWHEIKARLIPQLEHGMKDCGDHQLISYTRRWIRQFMAMGNGGSPGERQNLMAQLSMGLVACSGKGLIGKILGDFPPSVRNSLSQALNLDMGKYLRG